MDNELLTIKEAATIAGVHISTIYNLINSKKLEIKLETIGNRKVKKLIRKQVESVFNISKEIEENRKPEETIQNISNIVEETIQKYSKEFKNNLMKPIEEMALYKLGKLEEKLENISKEKEILLQENETLRNQLKALPDFQKEKETYESQVEILEKEKKDLIYKAETIQKEKDEQIRKTETLNQVLLDNANNIKELSKEKDKFQTALKEHEATIKEKEKILKDIEELRKQELEDLKKQTDEEKARLKSEAEEREKQIAEAWKKELELAKKPWWKFW